MTNQIKQTIAQKPKLRFPIFNDNWDKRRLDEIVQRITTKNGENNKNVLTISGQLGLINQEQFFTKSVSSKNTTNYYLMHKGDFSYNKSYSKGYPVGAIKRLKRYEKGIVSPLYICFRSHDPEIGDFLEKYFESGKQNHDISKIVQEGARNHGLLNISLQDFFKKITISIPSIPERQKIVDFLNILDNWAEILRNQSEILKANKKGLFQKILSCDIRFKDEDNNLYPSWEDRKLSDVLYEHKMKSTGNEEVYSVSVNKGLINQIEHLGRSYAALDTSKYNLVKPNDIVYTKSPTGNFPLGIIKQSRIDNNVIVSPLYGVFTPESPALAYILNVYFESATNTTNYLGSIVRKGAKNTINITNKIFLSKSLKLPVSKAEQDKICETLKVLDSMIKVKEKKIYLVEQWKKGLMQQMFV